MTWKSMIQKHHFIHIFILTVFFIGVSAVAFNGKAVAKTKRNDFYIKSSVEEGAKIYVRERYKKGQMPKTNEKAVLFIHGATYSGASFDLDVEGYGWMESAAQAGYACYYLDIRGYGRSTRPAALDEAPGENKPFSFSKDAVKDIDDAVRFILDKTAAEKINLVGWSWGTVTAGMYTAENNALVDRLVLFAPVYSWKVPSWTQKLADKEDPSKLANVGAYRSVDKQSARSRWEVQILPENKDEWRDDKVFDAWFKGAIETEPWGVVRAPNGVLVDIWEIFNARAIYDASKITAPTLVIRGSNDPTATRGDAQGLYDLLGSEVKRYVEIGNTTHFTPLERKARQLFREVQTFLDE